MSSDEKGSLTTKCEQENSQKEGMKEVTAKKEEKEEWL